MLPGAGLGQVEQVVVAGAARSATPGYSPACSGQVLIGKHHCNSPVVAVGRAQLESIAGERFFWAFKTLLIDSHPVEGYIGVKPICFQRSVRAHSPGR
jgi:hypothetical protein